MRNLMNNSLRMLLSAFLLMILLSCQDKAKEEKQYRISRLYSPRFLPVISMHTIASAIRMRLTSVEIPAPSKPSSGKPASNRGCPS